MNQVAIRAQAVHTHLAVGPACIDGSGCAAPNSCQQLRRAGSLHNQFGVRTVIVHAQRTGLGGEFEHAPASLVLHRRQLRAGNGQ